MKFSTQEILKVFSQQAGVNGLALLLFFVQKIWVKASGLSMAKVDGDRHSQKVAFS